jgi:hypothetical protein
MEDCGWWKDKWLMAKPRMHANPGCVKGFYRVMVQLP